MTPNQSNPPGSTEQAFALAVEHHRHGRLNEAKMQYEMVLDAQPENVAALQNLGTLLLQRGNNQQAIDILERVLILKPDYAGAFSNLGIAQKNLGQLHEAVASFEKALELDPDFLSALNNLAVTFKHLGQFDNAIQCNQKAILLDPTSEKAWNDLKATTRLHLHSNSQASLVTPGEYQGLNSSLRNSAQFSIFEYYLNSFRPHTPEAETSYDNATAAMYNFSRDSLITTPAENNFPPQFEQSVALLHFGRSGTGLMHSLIDAHPEVSTIPSIYLCGYFNEGIWEKLSGGGIEQIADRFANKFAVLFDATSPQPIPSTEPEGLSQIGLREGMTNVGLNRDEVLKVDRDIFCDEANRLLARSKKIGPEEFLHIAHAAYECAMGSLTRKKTMYYHVHNPGDFARMNFLAHMPDVRLMFMIRSPVQSLESWVRESAADNNYKEMSLRITTMLFGIDQIAFRKHDSIGVRLEDLKSRPKETIQALCKWIGIEENPCLFEMTAQGKKWWGDPTSPDYSDKKAMSPFDDSSTTRKVGSVFSENDQRLIETLFYPFSVLFNYSDEDSQRFNENLKEARISLDGLLDFEKTIIENKGLDPDQFQRSGDYLMLRAAFSDRLDVLDELGTYPHMLTPLAVDQHG